jgi:hypothetical protein
MVEVEPVFDARGEREGEPGLHALIVGISKYRHLPVPGERPTKHQQRWSLGLRQLTAAARTGLLVYQWLVDVSSSLLVPLTTCRTLLVPSDAELAASAELGDLAGDAALKTFLRVAQDWRDDVASNADNVAFFYFAGHGFQRKRGDQVLLLEDVGDGAGGKLTNAVDTFSLVQGMAQSEENPDIAQRQFFFFDACRMQPRDAYKYESQPCTAVFDPPTLTQDDRIVLEYNTAVPGAEAFAIRGEQTVFSKALLTAFAGAGAEEVGGRWCVTIDSLNRGLRYQMESLQNEYRRQQKFRVNGLGEDVVLCQLTGPPDVDVDLQVIPETAAARTAVTIDDLVRPEQAFGPPLDPQPFPVRLRAGQYFVTTRRDATGPTRKQLEMVAPPHRTWILAV